MELFQFIFVDKISGVISNGGFLFFIRTLPVQIRIKLERKPLFWQGFFTYYPFPCLGKARTFFLGNLFNTVILKLRFFLPRSSPISHIHIKKHLFKIPLHKMFSNPSFILLLFLQIHLPPSSDIL